jgi:hypothetical protein
VSAHTPGPWLVDAEPCIGGHRIVPRIGARGLATSVQRDPERGLPDSGIDADTSLANARLIAAAPDLLAVALLSAKALRLSGYLPDIESENPVCWLLEQTERAIAKARGEQ